MNPRSSGLLLHPSSLPGRWGIGDFGQQAFDFVDFLQKAGQRLWQILPLGPTGHGNSPYQCLSSFAGNLWLISLEELVKQGWLRHEEIGQAPSADHLTEEKVNYTAVTQFKRWCLDRAYDRFREQPSHEQQTRFATFCTTEQEWLEDFALFVAMKEHHGGAPWDKWERGAVLREPAALHRWKQLLHTQVEAHKFFQFVFFEQWRRVKDYANEKGMKIIGDIPIFVAYDGADVWSHPDLFFLDDERRPSVSAGVPPDYFSPTGQLWGNPLFRWERMAEDGYRWWISRVKTTLDLVDLVRLDHFRGFEAYWEVEAGEKTAANGRWVKGPGAQLFVALKDAIGALPFIAEDLGLITPEVEHLRDEVNLPGMKVLQFAFGDSPANPYLPHNHVRNSVVYTGTHDNDTTFGWYKGLQLSEQEVIENYVGHPVQNACRDLMRLAFSSVADMAIVPVQDILCLGTEARMNVPGVGTGNWEWRVKPGALSDQLAEEIKTITEFFGRGKESRKVELKKLSPGVGVA
ncbi:MAG: 4-alpha-glucanotransferase [Acidobacteria bacterium]|nr:MAG: 4-alpha-glucanotransferase [Acidobacteriota bacterium]